LFFKYLSNQSRYLKNSKNAEFFVKKPCSQLNFIFVGKKMRKWHKIKNF